MDEEIGGGGGGPWFWKTCWVPSDFMASNTSWLITRRVLNSSITLAYQKKAETATIQTQTTTMPANCISTFKSATLLHSIIIIINEVGVLFSVEQAVMALIKPTTAKAATNY